METLFDGKSDWDNANRFINAWGDCLRYVPKWQTWMTWDGHRWKEDQGAHQVQNLWKDTALEIYETAQHSKSLKDFAARCANTAGTDSAIKLARNDIRVLTDPGDFDVDPWVFNTATGMIDLRRESFKSTGHQADKLITKQSAVTYDAEATCPRFDQFLGEVFENNTELIAFIQRIFGLCLTGITRDHAVFIFYGTGANGKSTLLNVLAGLLGEYHAAAPSAAFFEDRSDNNTNDALAGLRGARAVACTEPSRQRPLHEAVIKKISGSDEVTARFLHGHFFSYMPTFKAILAVNHKPTVTGQELGIWRRVKMVPFNVNFLGREDHNLIQKLTAELPGILNWAIKGCLAWQEFGLNPPNSVVEATAEYRDDMDELGPWIAEFCMVDPTGPDGETYDSALYTSFKEYLGKDSRVPTRQRFSQMLTERGMPSKRMTKGRLRIGLRLKSDEERNATEFSWQTSPEPEEET